MADLSSVAAGKVQVGEYIKYTPGAGTYVAKADKTGHNADQTFTSTESVEDWRVLSVKGAEVTIVRDEPIYPTGKSDGLTLLGVTGYDNAIEVLNGICGIYKNPAYAKEARSIIVEDVNGITGYSSSDMAVYVGGTDGDGGYGFVNPEPINNKITGQDETHTQDYYQYIIPGNMGGNLIEENKMLIRSNDNRSLQYWIANRCVSLDSSIAFFRVRVINFRNGTCLSFVRY